MAKYDKQTESIVNSIIQKKGEYDNAGNDEARKKIANDAKAYYNQLISLGNYDVANNLKNQNYNESLKYQNALKKTGKTEFRPYMHELGKANGLTNAQVDALISWDNDTKEITFAGKKLGSPDAIVDGSSFFTDTTVLDNAMNEYTQRNGIYDPYKQIGRDEQYISQERRNNVDFARSNPFKTDWGKEMMSGVESEMKTAGDDAFASSAATNSGNIDSFAAANATRQKEAVLNTRKQSVLNHQYQVLANVENILNNMGIDNSRRSGIEENRLNGETNRLVQQSNVTGVVPTQWANSSNPFFNSDGTLKDENLDYQAIINQAKANGDEQLAQWARIARGTKMFGDLASYEKWGKYAGEGEYAFASPQITENARQFDETLEAQKDIASGKALEEFQTEAQKTAKQTVSNSLKNFNNGITDSEINVILFTSDGTPYFNPNLSKEEKTKHYNSLKTYLQNDPSIDDVLKQSLLDELNPNSNTSSKIATGGD